MVTNENYAGEVNDLCRKYFNLLHYFLQKAVRVLHNKTGIKEWYKQIK